MLTLRDSAHAMEMEDVPGRASLLTGKYPIHLGMQHDVLQPESKFGLPLGHKLLPAEGNGDAVLMCEIVCREVKRNKRKKKAAADAAGFAAPAGRCMGTVLYTRTLSSA